MNKYLIIACICLSACGGNTSSDPIINSAVSNTVTTPLDVNTTGIHIVKPSSELDGYSGGLWVTRDTTGKSGGTHGYVNSANVTHSIVGKDVIQFEWANLSIMDNYALRGENVGVYSQANKYNIGPTFGAVSEVNDTTGLPGAAVGHEIDLFITGPDNGNRIGLDLVVGDSRYIRGLGKSAQAAGTVGIRIGPSQGTPWATLTNGLEIRGAVTDNAIVIYNSFNGQPVFEVKANGDIYQRGVLLR